MNTAITPSEDLSRRNPKLWTLLCNHKNAMREYKNIPMYDLTAEELKQIAAHMLNHHLPPTQKHSILTVSY